jgi:hypothetical protein
VVPLHGRGNKNGEGDGVKSLFYAFPKDPKSEWNTQVIDDSLHMTHNFDVVQWDADPEEELIIGGREGVFLLDSKGEKWARSPLAGTGRTPQLGAGEVRLGKVGESRFIAAIEPMHGTNFVVYLGGVAAGERGDFPNRSLVDGTIVDGHALACTDLLNLGSDQVVVGWRAMGKKDVPVGIKIFVFDSSSKNWKSHSLDENQMACEDLVVADLDGDKKLDVIAAGRATKNVKIFWNRSQ